MDDNERETAERPSAPLLSGDLKPSRFISAVAARVQVLAREHRDMRYIVRSQLMQCWSGATPANHFEVWLHEREGKIEIGMHFEGHPEENARYFKYLDSHMLEIHATLGDRLWLEDWDRGWVRLYESVPFAPLDASKVDEVAMRLTEIIDFLVPLLEHTPTP